MPSETPNKRPPPRRILARSAPEDFVGRRGAAEQIAALAPHGAERRGLLLFAAPSAGASELLRQAYDGLFQQRGAASPVYFAWTRSDRTTVAAARRFLHTFLLHLIAHRRDTPSLIDAQPTMHDLLDLAVQADYEWVERLIQSYERARKEADEGALVRLCLGAPQQAAEHGARSVVLFDDLHHVEQLDGEVELGAEIAQVATQAEVPFVLGGLRRRLLDVLHGPEACGRFDRFGTLHVEQLGYADAREAIERLADTLRVPLSDEARDLLIHQFAGSPVLIAALLRAAQAAGAGLVSFLDCQRLYVDELLGGRINRRLNSVLEGIIPREEARRALIRELHESGANMGGRSPVEAWRRRLSLETDELQRVMRGLHAYELTSFDSTFVKMGTSLVWRDYLHTSYRLQIAGETRALVVADTLVETLKRAPQTMARHYRREAALKLRDLLRRFNHQRVPASLLHNDRFNRMYRGINMDEVASGLNTETDLVRLPQIVHTASGAAFHPPLQLVCDEERCGVAHGFDSTPYTDSSEVVWVAAEVESKVEAGRAITELWCDRLTQLALACGFGRVRLWLVASEGFSAEASDLLNERDAFSSSRQQLELLTARLGADSSLPPRSESSPDEFEMVIPMGGDTELIAANTIEQIARRLDFQAEAINQIKTALVEACINAEEHSLSPDRKIYQRFRVESDKLIVTVSSRGVAITPGASQDGELLLEQKNGHETDGATKGRRGWGLRLIRTLMDEVEFERVDDGTRLRMTKYLRK